MKFKDESQGMPALKKSEMRQKQTMRQAVQVNKDTNVHPDTPIVNASNQNSRQCLSKHYLLCTGKIRDDLFKANHVTIWQIAKQSKQLHNFARINIETQSNKRCSNF